MTATTTVPPRPPEPGPWTPHPPTTPRRPRTGVILVVLALVVTAIAAVGALSLTVGSDEVDVIRPTTDVTRVEIDIDGGTIVAPHPVERWVMGSITLVVVTLVGSSPWSA